LTWQAHKDVLEEGGVHRDRGAPGNRLEEVRAAEKELGIE
jgi:hypothetical protein